jgi:UDP-N-acetylmuramate dehydrogenase
MPTIQHNISLQSLNTFHCEAIAKHFCIIRSTKELTDAIHWANENKLKVLTLGGGSNIIFTKDFDGLVLKMEIKGVQKLAEQDQIVTLKVGAGENWHHFVQYAIEKGWSGIENLSLIPGTVGASPIQNIGAYGVEVKDVIKNVEVYDLLENKMKTISHHECQFGYRDSIFKQNKDRYIIVAVVFQLSTITHLHLEYGAIREELHHRSIKNPNLKDVSNAVIAIRQSKLPNPLKIGNAGSFFKNPIIDSLKHEELTRAFPQIVTYPIDNNYYKVAAGWLIENAGFKGKNDGKVGTFEKQALVLINYNNATGKDVMAFSEEIIKEVQKKYDLTLEREVNIF